MITKRHSSRNILCTCDVFWCPNQKKKVTKIIKIKLIFSDKLKTCFGNKNKFKIKINMFSI